MVRDITVSEPKKEKGKDFSGCTEITDETKCI